MSVDRRSFLLRAGAGLALAGSPVESLAASGPTLPQPSAHEALATLLAGNARFLADKATCPPLTARRLELANGQNPFAIVVSCSDSRVPVETVFDQPPGSIFGVRVAGNFVDTHGLGSIEYSVASFKSPLILVLGHSACGAVKATVQFLKDGTKQPGDIQSLIDAIAPSARAADHNGDWVANATARNVHDTIAALASRSSIVASALKAGELAIAGGVYDLHSGKVTVIT
jgi:carbonic anhydrase